MAKRINCHKDFRPQVDVQTPDDYGNPNDPGAGAITTLVGRISTTETGPAIHVDVDALAFAETPLQGSADARRFFAVIDKILMETHVLPLGVGTSFYVIYSKSGDADFMAVRYLVDDRDRVT